LWAYVRDERSWQGSRAPAAYYRFSPDRRGERPRDHLAIFRGVICDRRVVGVDDRRRHDMGTDPLGQRRHPSCDMAHPVGQGGAFDLDAFPRHDRRLPEKRLTVEILADHHVGDETGAGTALLDRQVGRWRLHDPLSLGRIWRITLSRAGSFSNTSVTSSPSLVCFGVE
jgi:hypothetical protein